MAQLTTEPPPKPVVVIVSGAWLTAALYEPFRQSLVEAGFHAECPPLATENNAHPPTASLHDDGDAIAARVSQLADAGHAIMVLAHSYGGMVASDAISVTEHGFQARKARGLSGGVVRLIYVAAYILPPPLGISSTWEWPADKLKTIVVTPHDDGTADLVNPGPAILNNEDESSEEVVAYTRGLVSQPLSSITAGARQSAWKELPMTYVICGDDRSCTTQKDMLDLVKGDVKAGLETVLFSKASHWPFGKEKEKLIELLKRTWEEDGSKL